MRKAVVLLSGGLDSATTMAMAKDQNYSCYALSFNYAQRSTSELHAAQRIAKQQQAKAHQILNIDLGLLGGSALTDTDIAIPKLASEGIPVTYVPARNTIFLSFALAYAEVLGASDIFIGVNAVDYSGYPDCRPEYIDAFTKMANLATKSAVESMNEQTKIKIHTPLMSMGKEEIIQTGVALGVDYAATVSCYDATSEGAACGVCDSCRIRADGFEKLGYIDPTIYRI